MRPISLTIAALVLAALTPQSASAQGARATSAIEFARQAEALKPGEWVWAPEIAPGGPVQVYVDLSRQLATVYRNGVRIGVSTVSSGKAGHETPTGVFTILQKDANHRSSKYNNAPMKFQERLTWDGVALHAGGLPGYPESHGCVHLPLEFSRLLFGATEMGGTVVIAGRAGGALVTDSAGVLAPIGEGGATSPHIPLTTSETYRWTPEASPDGPVAIIFSQSDGRVVVLRNGVEIGRARAALAVEDFETHVFTFAPAPDGRARWTVLGVPGHAGQEGQSLDVNVLS